jgi:CTP synthase
MRLGSYKCKLAAGSRARAAYGAELISERHRHRYEFNGAYRAQMVAKGLKIAGEFAGKDLVEIVENPGSPWFVACQFHPEFQSKPNQPHPLFREFIRAALAKHEQKP